MAVKKRAYDSGAPCEGRPLVPVTRVPERGHGRRESRYSPDPDYRPEPNRYLCYNIIIINILFFVLKMCRF